MGTSDLKVIETYGHPIAANVELQRNCWVWQPKTIGRPQFEGKWIVKMPGYYNTCYQDLCINPDHCVDATTEPGLMMYVRQHCMHRPSGCWYWHGKRRKGTPVMPVPGERKPQDVRLFNYRVEFVPYGQTLPEGTQAENTCGESRCVAPEHTRVTSSHHDELTERQSPGKLGFLKLTRGGRASRSNEGFYGT